MRWLADVLYFLAGIAYLPILLYQATVVGKNRSGWRERFGAVPRRPVSASRIWIHAVSLGEINATPKLIEALRQRVSEGDIVVSTTTDTGFARAVTLYGRQNVFRFPLDFSMVIRRVLDRLQPTAIVLMEAEVWYNLVCMASQRGIDVAVVNGRLTERSERRFRRLGRLVRPMFSKLAWVGAQDEVIADRFRRLGVASERIEVIPSLKWDSAAVADTVPGADALAAALAWDPSAAVWVCGSTGPGEEEQVLEAFEQIVEPDRNAARNVPQNPSNTALVPTLVIVPRKPERFDEVAALIEQRGYACVRRSRRPDGTTTPIETALPRRVFLGDTMGELRKFYAKATVVFIGRTLVPLGGSDPMEAAALGKPIVVGPYIDNFLAPVRALEAAGAICTVDSTPALAREVRKLLADPGTRERLGARAREVVLSNQGGTERTVRRLTERFSHGFRGGSVRSARVSPTESSSAVPVATDSS